MVTSKHIIDSDFTSVPAIVPDGGDYMLVSDTSASGAIRRTLVSDLPSGGGGGGVSEDFVIAMAVAL